MCLYADATEVVQVDEAKPIVAWRAYLPSTGGRLQPVVFYRSPLALVAEADRMPEPGNSNGIHAYASRDRLEKEQGTDPIWAVVKLWGQVVKHGDEGYRAQFSRVVKLYCQEASDCPCQLCSLLGDPEVRAAIAEYYGVQWVDSAEELVA